MHELNFYLYIYLSIQQRMIIELMKKRKEKKKDYNRIRDHNYDTYNATKGKKGSIYRIQMASMIKDNFGSF